jgi:TfoX/Sxy family transcriptional regulator of competence genes
VTEAVKIAFDTLEYITESGETIITEGIMQRLDISNDTLVKGKRKLEEDGYIFTYRGWDKGRERALCNVYWLFDYEYDEDPKRQRKPDRYAINQMLTEQRNTKRGKEKQANADSIEPTTQADDVVDFDF